MSFVLIHGAGYGASCWNELVPLLKPETLAVDLPGRGTRSATDLRTVTLQDCADAVVADPPFGHLTANRVPPPCPGHFDVPLVRIAADATWRDGVRQMQSLIDG